MWLQAEQLNARAVLGWRAKAPAELQTALVERSWDECFADLQAAPVRLWPDGSQWSRVAMD